MGRMIRSLFASFALLALASGCDCSGALVGPPPCESDSPPAGCGSTCSATVPCRAGLYCGPGGECTADCTAGEACNGGTCSSEGRCVASELDGGGRDGAPPDAIGIDNTCGSVQLGANRTT